jgi:polar amino acid transport system substrate-binding protein
LFVLVWASPLIAKSINVGFEPFPPMVTENGQGHVITMLRAIEKISDFKFNIKIMTYARAKQALKNHQLDLIGLTPQHLETENFYHYAQDIDWNIAAHVDIFSLKDSQFDITNTPDASIGTLIGNADFFSILLDIPRDKFVEVTNLEQLVKMLSIGRLEKAAFERVAMMSTIKRLNIKNIHYQKFGIIPASMAVSNTPNGNALKSQLDALIKKANISTDDEHKNVYQDLPNQGIVNI